MKRNQSSCCGRFAGQRASSRFSQCGQRPGPNVIPNKKTCSKRLRAPETVSDQSGIGSEITGDGRAAHEIATSRHPSTFPKHFRACHPTKSTRPRLPNSNVSASTLTPPATSRIPPRIDPCRRFDVPKDPDARQPRQSLSRRTYRPFSSPRKPSAMPRKGGGIGTPAEPGSRSRRGGIRLVARARLYSRSKTRVRKNLGGIRADEHRGRLPSVVPRVPRQRVVRGDAIT